jgi:hypothetical protein
MAWRQTGREIRNYEFVLDTAPDSGPAWSPAEALWLRLDDAAMARKLAAARAYPEMREEVEVATRRFGPRAFAVECLQPAATGARLARFEEDPPAYERHGQTRVGEGVYREIIRYREHVQPVLAAIEEHAG